MILLMIMMIIDEMICVERRTQKKILRNDDDDDHKDDDDDVLIMMMIVIYFRSLFSHKCEFLQLRPNWSTLQMFFYALIETFRFEDENDYEYEIELKVFPGILKKWTPRNASLYFFSLEKIALLSILKEMKPSLDCKMIKPLIFDNSFPPLRHSR